MITNVFCANRFAFDGKMLVQILRSIFSGTFGVEGIKSGVDTSTMIGDEPEKLFQKTINHSKDVGMKKSILTKRENEIQVCDANIELGGVNK